METTITLDAVEYIKKLEEEIVGTLVSYPESYEKIDDILEPRFFYYANHRQLAERIINKIKMDVNSVNPVSLAYDFQELKVNIAITTVPTSVYIRSHCEELKNLYLWRRTREVAGEILHMSEPMIRDKEALSEMVSGFRQKVAEIEEANIPKATHTKSMAEAVSDLADYLSDDTPDPSIMSGFPDLDYLTGGFQQGELTVIGARPSMGKTAFSLALLEGFSKQKKKTLYFTLEMPIRKIMLRMAAMKAMIPRDKLRKNQIKTLTEEEWHRITDQISILQNYPVFFHDRKCKVDEIRLLAKQQMRQNGLDCIIIDHMSKIAPDNPRASGYDQITQIVCGLKDIAKELNIHVIVLSQLSRAVEQRNNKRPMLSDLRESGHIEQEADLVMFLYRDDYYNEDSELAGCMEVLIEKQRDGQLGVVLLGFLKKYVRVVSLGSEDKATYREALLNQ